MPLGEQGRVNGLPVQRERSERNAAQTADGGGEEEGVAKSIAAVKRMEPPYTVAIQLKIFTPVGRAMRRLDAPNAESQAGPRPTTNV